MITWSLKHKLRFAMSILQMITWSLKHKLRFAMSILIVDSKKNESRLLKFIIFF